MGGTWLIYVHRSEWYKTECLVLNSTIIRIPCGENHNGFIRICYYPTWSLYARDRDAKYVYGYATTGMSQTESDAERDRLHYRTGQNYSCYLQVGNNTWTDEFIWPNNPLLDVQTGLLASTITVSLGCSFLIVMMLIFCGLYIKQRLWDRSAESDSLL